MDEARGELPFPEHLYPEATPGTVLRVWCLDFPPRILEVRFSFDSSRP